MLSHPRLPRLATTLKVHADDDLIVALADLPAGRTVEHNGREYILPQHVPVKHKFAARAIQHGERVRMYGVTVGIAQADIAPGELITTDNLVHATDEPVVHARRRVQWQPPDASRFAGRTFHGYRRLDGRIGTANHWLVIPLVFCENRNIDTLREALLAELGYHRGGGYRAVTRSLVENTAAARRRPRFSKPPSPTSRRPNPLASSPTSTASNSSRTR